MNDGQLQQRCEEYIREHGGAMDLRHAYNEGAKSSAEEIIDAATELVERANRQRRQAEDKITKLELEIYCLKDVTATTEIGLKEEIAELKSENEKLKEYKFMYESVSK